MIATEPASVTKTVAAWGARLLGVRRLVRAPIFLYRARLGFLLGSRLLMLEHIGRKSGARRYALLEVVDHSRPGTYLVASGSAPGPSGTATSAPTPASGSTSAAIDPCPRQRGCSAPTSATRL